MEVNLVVAKGPAQRRVLRLRSAETVIGRRQDCELRIASSEVSRRHCLLSVHDGYVMVQDLDSVNGTFVNGQRVEGKQRVHPGDRLDIGPICLVVDYVESSAPRAAVAAPPDEAPLEELEVLPAIEDGASPFAFVNDVEPLDDLPLAEEDTDDVPREAGRAAAARQEEEIEEVLPVLEDEEELPEAEDRENIIFEKNDPRGRKGPSGRR